jgi:pimeloyl-ACP methyl ester carboxylesterase
MTITAKIVIALIVLAGFWALVLYRAGQAEAAAEAAFPPEGQVLTIDGHQVHALVMGEGHEPESIAALIPLAAPSNPWSSELEPLYKLTSHPLLAPIVNPLITAFAPDRRVEQAVAGVFEPNAVPEGYLAHFGAALTLRRDSLRANGLQRRNLLGEIEELVPLYGRIDVPTEIVHGDADTTVGLSIHAEPLATQIPDAVLTHLPGIGHMPQHAAPDAVIAAIDRVARRAGLR